MHTLFLVLVAAFAEPLVLPATRAEITFSSDVAPAVEAAMTDLAARRFGAAAAGFRALSEASASADLAYLHAVSAYEAGELREAGRAAELGLSRDASHAPLLALRGLILADQGQGDKALQVLRQAESSRGDDEVLGARIALNRALVHLDLGGFAAAEADLSSALVMAQSAGDLELEARVRENQAVLEAARGRRGDSDALAKVSDALRRGQTEKARTLLPTATADDRRGTVRRALALGAIQRAEGQFGAAAVTLQEALTAAREGGLVRETAALLAELGAVFRVGGRPVLSREPLAEAVSLVAGSSFRINEVSYRVEAGRVALAVDDLDSARGQLERARRAARETEDPTAPPRLDELEGAILARSGDGGKAEEVLGRAQAALELGDWHADAARVAVLRVELQAQMQSRRLDKTRRQALDAFERAGDPLGPIHVAMAEGVGRARARDGAGALEAFLAASTAAGEVGGIRAEALEALARENAAQVLVSMGQSGSAVEVAREHGLADSVARLASFEAAKKSYDEGLTAFNAGQFGTSYGHFHEAFEAFEALDEEGFARQSRAARAWSTFNGGHGGEPVKRMVIYADVVQEALMVGDVELEARALGARALAADEADFGEVDDLLRDALKATEKLGLRRVSGQLYAAVATRPGDLEERAGAARRAMDLLEGEEAAVYAIYSVAVDAYNGDRPQLSVALAERIVGRAGRLEADVRAVLDAARAQQ